MKKINIYNNDNSESHMLQRKIASVPKENPKQNPSHTAKVRNPKQESAENSFDINTNPKTTME